MKKYLQITIVLAIVGLIIVFKELMGNQAPGGVVSNNQKTPTPSSSSAGSSSNQSSTAASYKDGTYTGDTEDAFYGNVQVSVLIANGKITNVNFLQAPNAPGHTSEVSQMAVPALQQEAIQVQNANVDIVSGATQTSGAFIKSFQSALSKAKS